MNFKKLTICAVLGLTSFKCFADTDPLPALDCGNVADINYLNNLTMSCHYSDAIQTGQYIEAPEDVGVKLVLPDGVDISDSLQIQNALKKSIVLVDGWNSDFNSHLIDIAKEYKEMGASIVWIVPGKSYTEGTLSYATKAREVLNDLYYSRIGISDTKPIIVLGYSLGGVAARLALAEMEQNGEQHDAALFVSYDAPQTGITTPQFVVQSYQLLQDYMTLAQSTYDNADPILKPYLSKVKEGAQLGKDGLDYLVSSYVNSLVFKEILIDNALATGNERQNYIDAINAIGYPSIRKVAISLGSLGAENKINVNAINNTYYNFDGKTNAGSAYGYLKMKAFPSNPGVESVVMDIGAVAQKTTTYKCYIWFTCTNTVTVKASLPRSRTVATTVTNFDKIPGSWIDNAKNATGIVGSTLKSGMVSGCNVDNSPIYALLPLLPIATYTNQDKYTPSCINAELYIPAFGKDDVTAVYENEFQYTFLPTASAFGLPVSASVGEIQAAYSDNSLTPFNKLYSLPEELGKPNENLSHGDVRNFPALLQEINTVLN